MKEIWRDVVGYEKYFMVSNFGNVWSKRTKIILVPTVTKAGYNTISTKLFGRLGGSKIIRIHRMVAEAFIKNPENKPYVNHLDGNKKNNFVTNLEWCTAKENTIHAYKTGLSKITSGAENHRAKLTWEQVEEIRNNYDKNKETHAEIAERYGVERTCITNLINKVTYKEK